MSVRVVGQVALNEAPEAADRERVAEALVGRGREIEGVSHAHAGVHLDLSVGGGEITWDLVFESEAAVGAFCERLSGTTPENTVKALGAPFAELGPAIASVELAIPEPLDARQNAPNLVGVKRTLWLRVLPGTDPDALAQFEAETPLLAEAVPAIRNWRWSRVRTAVPNPMALRWTHLWEQEFETSDGLQIDYMSSPSHWGYIDRWFDPEMPDQIVDLWLAHLACPESAPVLSWDAETSSSAPR